MDKLTPTWGNTRYGIDDVTFAENTVTTYCLLISTLAGDASINSIIVDTYNLGKQAGGDIKLNLVSLDGSFKV